MRLMIICFALAMLAGCPATAPIQQPQTRVIDSSCSWVKLITVVPADSEETKRQVLAHDKALIANCPSHT